MRIHSLLYLYLPHQIDMRPILCQLLYRHNTLLHRHTQHNMLLHPILSCTIMVIMATDTEFKRSHLRKRPHALLVTSNRPYATFSPFSFPHLQFDSPFRQGSMFGQSQSSQDLHSQYGGLFYSAAPSSSSMVGSTPFFPVLHDSYHSSNHPTSAVALASYPHGRNEAAHNLRHAFTAPTSPSIPVPFAYNANEDDDMNGSALPTSFPSIKSILEEDTVDPKGLLGSSSSSVTPFVTSPTSRSRSDDNQSVTSQSSADSSPVFRTMKSFQTVSSPTSPLHLTLHSEPCDKYTQSTTSRLFGSHMSHMMHDDSDSPFTTDFSSSEEEAFSH